MEFKKQTLWPCLETLTFSNRAPFVQGPVSKRDISNVLPIHICLYEEPPQKWNGVAFTAKKGKMRQTVLLNWTQRSRGWRSITIKKKKKTGRRGAHLKLCRVFCAFITAAQMRCCHSCPLILFFTGKKNWISFFSFISRFLIWRTWRISIDLFYNFNKKTSSKKKKKKTDDKIISSPLDSKSNGIEKKKKEMSVFHSFIPTGEWRK